MQSVCATVCRSLIAASTNEKVSWSWPEVSKGAQHLERPAKKARNVHLGHFSTFSNLFSDVITTVSLVRHIPLPIFSTSYNSNKRIIRKLLSMEFQTLFNFYN